MSFEEKKLLAQSLQQGSLASSIPWQALEQGKRLWEQGNVTITESSDTLIRAVVKDKGEKQVEFQLSGNRLLGKCSCISMFDRTFCRHLAAAGLAGHKLLADEIKKSWENRLSFVHETPRLPQKNILPATDFVLVFLLWRDSYAYKIVPAALPVNKVPPKFQPQTREWTREEVVDALARDSSARAALTTTPKFALEPATCVNTTSEAVSLAKMLNHLATQSRPSYYYGSDYTDTSKVTGETLEILRELDVPLYPSYQTGNGIALSGLEPLKLLRERANALLDVENTKEGGLRLQFMLYLGTELWKVGSKKLAVVSESPLWFLLDDQLIPADDNLTSEQIDQISKSSRVTIPPEEKDIFYQHYLPALAQRFNFTGSGIQTNVLDVEPQPRLYLEDNQGTLEVWLTYGYGEFEVDFESRIPETTSSFDPEKSIYTRIIRKAEAEKKAFAQVSEFGLKRASGEPGLFNLRSKVDLVDFLMRYIPKATAAGFEVYGEENIKNVKVNRNKPVISFFVSSGIDWFDLNAVVSFGELNVPLKEIRKTLKRKEQYIKLADGTMGEIPEEWVERYKHLFTLGQDSGEGLRFSQSQITLLDQLLETENANLDENFQRKRERLRQFTSLTPQPLPEGLQGELRPYQKAGLDWLHFLHEYEFGGCLADDMGLGKTFQVLAFLQSLKERGAAAKATLVVVPRSLLVNWQREIEKFTPGLTVLEYHGQLREKDTTAFDQYDLVVTTYGVVVKDIELFRAYTFHYAILDESQAIKNPLSQSAKACRLLNCEHRLVITGTPVENNTFELWSQFAFINPGLLGSMDYFKEEFSGRIERQRDEASAQTLRKLVYPFILRRTKEQVAPELPPRTERIVYGEMEAAQRKVYNHTREEFRKQLLGLIETEGMNNARMKILEGLLRLRQICIHPKLVQPSYKGESAKFELLLETIDTLRAEGHKALIFSQFVETLKLLRADLDAQSTRYAYLDGQTVNRQEQVDEFQNDPNIPFFLLSLKAGGVGLNLTAAEYVIHIDPWWNPAVEMQASDRVHRIGQEKPVFIYKYILRDTVEEKILQLQEQKRQLVEQLISTDGSFFKNITSDDVKALFS